MSTTIYGYHSYPNVWYKKRLESEDNATLYIGIELECEPNDTLYYNDREYNETRQKIADYVGELFYDNENGHEGVYVSKDSSLRNNGLEFVFHPMTLAYFNANIDKFKDALEFINANNFRSHNGGNCGLHIHFTRPYERDSEQDRDFMNKTYFIFESFKDVIKTISRRQNFSYCQFFSDEHQPSDAREYKSLYNLAKINKASGHDTAINNGNSKTIEIRILRGTLNIDTFKNSINFIASLFKLAFKDIKDLDGLSLKKIVKDDADIKAFLKTKDIDTSIKLVDYSKTMIKLEKQANAILLKSNKILNKIMTAILGDVKRAKLDLTKADAMKNAKDYVKTLNTLIDRADVLNSNIGYINDYISGKPTYYSYNALLESVGELARKDYGDNKVIKDLQKQLLSIANVEL